MSVPASAAAGPSSRDGGLVVVGMATFQRPDTARRALDALVAQTAAGASTSAQTQVPIIVVDNDAAGNAREMVGEYADRGVIYVHEPTPGLSAARNRALDEAEALGADAIVFTDDDEEVTPGWLDAHISLWRERGCAGVAGPAEPVLEVPADAWIEATRVFATKSLPTGTVVPGAGSGNLLLDLRVLRRLGLRFDPAYGASGGEDTKLTHQLRAAGEQILWCEEAHLLDHIPASRISREWVTQRTFRMANSWARVVMDTHPGNAKRGELGARGASFLARGAAKRAVAAGRREVALDAEGAMDIARGFGVLSAVRGQVAFGYKR